MKIIPLTQGKVALVDDRDFEWLNEFKWYADNVYTSFIAVRNLNSGLIRMHREIMKTPDDLVVDHIDHDTLNNQRYNLRNCTQSQNLQNMQVDQPGYYKGIYKHTKSKRWIAQIRVNGVLLHLGCFSIDEEAARAYDEAARRYFGEFATLNFAKEGERSYYKMKGEINGR